MNKLLTSLCFLLVSTFQLAGQSPLTLEKGQEIKIRVEIKNNITQQAGAQVIRFATDATALHTYKVTNVTDKSFTLHHEIKNIDFRFDGMGQTRSFNSDKEEDKKGPFGPYFKDVLSKKFDITIDPSGKTLNTSPEKVELSKADDKLITITDMLKHITQLAHPPKKETGSFFYAIPPGKKQGDTWNETIDTENEKATTVYTLSAITDTSYVVDFKTTSNCTSQSEMMGRVAKTTSNNTITGKIFINKSNGIVKEKNSIIETTGTTEAMGSTVPINGKCAVNVKVE